MTDETDQVIALSCEVMLAGWAKSTSKAEPKATFFFSSDEDLAPLELATIAKGKNAGQRYMMVLVEIGSDELPIPKPEQPKGGPLARWAGILCSDPVFWEWLNMCLAARGFAGIGQAVLNKEDARLGILEMCNIESRRMLDHDPIAARKFREEIMAPFDAWRGARGR